MVKRKLLLLCLSITLIVVSLAAFAISPDDWSYERSLPFRLYAPHDTHDYYLDAQTACEAATPAVDEAHLPSDPWRIVWDMPAPGLHSAYTMGCWYRETETNVVSGEEHVHTYFYAGQIFQDARCPLGTTYYSNIAGGVCQKPRPPEKCAANDCVGNPISPGLGMKSQVEVDYQSASARSPLFFIRQYASWNPLSSPNTLGKNWFIHIFGRYLTLDTSFIVATRSLGNSKPFDLSGSNWVPRTATADTLAPYSDGNGSAWRYYDSERLAYEYYDAGGVLLRVQQLNGDTYTLIYSTSSTSSSIAPFAGLLIEIDASSGAKLYLTYDSQGLLNYMQDPAGQTYTYTYNNGYLQSVEYPDSTIRQYTYENSNGPIGFIPTDSMTGLPSVPISLAALNTFSIAAGASQSADALTHVENFSTMAGENEVSPLTGIIDENGDRFATWQYDGAGRPIVSTHANGAEHVSLTYNSISVTVTSALGNVNTYNYTTNATRAQLTSISGNPCLDCNTFQSFQYNNGLITRAYDWNGKNTNYTYDSRGQQASRREGVGTAQDRTISTTWHSTFGGLPTLITESGKTTAFTYDSNGLLTQKTITDTASGASRTWTYTYTGNGQLYTVNGPRTDVSDITTFTYDSDGNISSITDPLSHVTQITNYDANGHPLTIIDPNGTTTTLTYDLRGRLTSRTTGSEVTTYTYDNVGQLTRVTLPDGSYLNYTYDAAHRLTSIADRAGDHIDYTLDAAGNRTQEDVYDPNDVLAQTRSRVYSTINRLDQELGSLGQTTSYIYDNNGNPTSSTDPLSHTTGRTFDTLNRLTQITDPNSGTTKFTYNLRDQLTKVTDARNHDTTYTVDALDNLKQVVSPDTGTTTNTYDAAGNLLTSTDARGAVTTYTYDALNRVTQASSVLSGNTVTTTFAYDTGTNGIGHLTGMSDANSTTTYSYDSHGRLTSKTQTTGTVSLTTSYTYDGTTGQLTSMTYPSGKVVGYSYDTQSRVTEITVDSNTLLTGANYAPFGNAIGWTWGNSGTYSRPLDTDGRVASYKLGGITTSLTYDDASRITGVGSQTYGYDILDRLTSYTGLATQAFGYDATGNRTSFTQGSSDTYSITSTNNRIASISGLHSRTYSYNSAGSVTADSVHTYTYDPKNRLTGVDGTSSYIINGLGQRIKKTVSSTSTLFVYDEQGQLIGEYSSTGTPVNETVYLANQPVGVLTASAMYYVDTDQLNTPRGIRNGSNTIIWRWDSDPFGTTAANDDPDADSVTFTYNLRFPGQYYDTESGLNYNYFRDYDAVIGRYIQNDPIGQWGGINTYAYVDNDPSTGIDRNGLMNIGPGGSGPGDNWLGGGAGGGGSRLSLPTPPVRPALPVSTIQARGLPPEGFLPPVRNPQSCVVGPASRPSELAKGGKSLWDEYGGEWRYYPGDKVHNPHWDYNPHVLPNSPWQNIQLNPNLPVFK